MEEPEFEYGADDREVLDSVLAEHVVESERRDAFILELEEIARRYGATLKIQLGPLPAARHKAAFASLQALGSDAERVVEAITALLEQLHALEGAWQTGDDASARDRHADLLALLGHSTWENVLDLLHSGAGGAAILEKQVDVGLRALGDRRPLPGPKIKHAELTFALDAAALWESETGNAATRGRGKESSFMQVLDAALGPASRQFQGVYQSPERLVRTIQDAEHVEIRGSTIRRYPSVRT